MFKCLICSVFFHMFTQVVFKHKGGPKETAVLHHPPRWRLCVHTSCQQRAYGHSEKGKKSVGSPFLKNPNFKWGTGFFLKLSNSLSALWQVAERLECDLGVQVQTVCLPELRYSFQIWDKYMGLPDKEGKVGPDDTHIFTFISSSMGFQNFFLNQLKIAMLFSWRISFYFILFIADSF